MALTPLMVGRLDEGLRVRLRRGIKAWSEYLTGHLEVGGQAARVGRRRREKEAMVGRCRRKTKLTARPHMAERHGRGGQLGRCEPKRKTYSREDATDARARWAGRGSFGLWGQRGRWAGWANGRVGRRVSQAESKEKVFLN
jgi:hypothetical protein